MPIDINLLRAEKGGDPEYWRGVLRKRFMDVALVDRVIDLDQQWRKSQYKVEQARKELGLIQKKVTEAKKAKDDATADALINGDMATIKASIPDLEAEVEVIRLDLDKALNKVPNDVHPGVPVSKDEADNTVVKTWGECTTREGLLHHHELLWMIDGYEPERGVGVAGHRAYFLKGVGLLLNQALIAYGLSYLSNRSYTPLMPPFFMNRDVMAGVAQLEDFDEQLYKVSGESGDDTKYLIATSEQPICAYHRGEWLAEKDLPMRYAGYSACFRKEAGSHGRDTWGIFRVHQFDKVEQFLVCEPEHSAALHQEMVDASAGFYESLGIAYRVVNICSGELNNAAAIKYDLEGWFPTLGNFRELVSTSNCTDYQSRAMEVRCGLNKKAGPAGEPAKKYVHFLNGTLCATTRTICAILENNQTSEGVKVPEVLVPFMGGRTFLPFTREKPLNQEIKKANAAAAASVSKAAPAAPAATIAAPVQVQAKIPVVAAAPKLPAATTVAPPPAAKKGGVLEEYERVLVGQAFLAGHTPGEKDAKAVEEVQHMPSGEVGKFPCVQRWVKQCLSFSPSERSGWK